MNNLQRYTKFLIKWVFAAVFLMPAVGWTHGAVDTPIARQVKCQKDGGYWASQDGSSIKDKGCRGAAQVFPTPAEWAYQFQQWNEVAHLIAAPGYNDPNIVEQEVPDHKLCSAGDDKKDGLNRVSADWFRTDVTPVNGMMKVRIIGTAPHVPSFAKVFLTKPGFDPSKSPLTWKDLVLIHTEQLTVAKTNWGDAPPAISGASGYFEFLVPVPTGQNGNATLFVQWQRIDPAGEGFYNCSDINIVNAGTPGQWFDIGQFIDAIMGALKVDDSVHFRILDNTPAAKEIVDITLPITASNLNPKIWGQQLANQINPAIAKVGEKQGSNIVFNTVDPSANSVFSVVQGYAQAMAIIPGGGPINPDPRSPVASIKALDPVKSGDPITVDGTGSVFYNQGKKIYQWSSTHGVAMGTTSVVNTTAPAVTTPTDVLLYLTVYDGVNNTKSDEVKITLRVNPHNSGLEPPYVPGKAYNAGDKVSNHGQNYECMQGQSSGWCKLGVYEPGHANGNWTNAWKKIP